tara:strand:- start:463 stop:1266 length:804 start_codon:yes stop_codon:yes gene_type:complete
MKSYPAIRHSTGWTITILGALGSALCLALLIAVWIGSHKANESLDHVFNSASKITQRIHSGTQATTGLIEEFQSEVVALQLSLETAVEKASEQITGNPASVEELSARLQPLREWLALSEGVGELIEVVEGSLESTGVLIGSDLPTLEKLLVTTQKGRAQIAEASLALTEIEASLTSIRDPGAGKNSPGKVKSVFQQASAALDRLNTASTDFSAALDEVDDSMATVAQKIRKKIRLIALISSVFLVWQLAAQCCLAKAGWKWRSAKGQ